MTDRLRGRRGVEQRKRRLRLHPLCSECARQRRVRQADEIDHIVPLALGGTDTDDNVQGLCADCHAAKSASEDASNGGGARHPHWLKPSAVPLEIVSGPPCSGKTTYVRQHATDGDTVIDLDDIMVRLHPGYRHWSGSMDPELFNAAIRMRNAMLGALHRQQHGKAWFIISAPAQVEREWWQIKLGGTITLLHPGVDECKRRAIVRDTPRAAHGVDAWERASRMPWAPKATPKAKVTTGTDGWPVGRG